MENIEIALRCHVETGGGKKYKKPVYEDLPRRTLTFDTETAIDQYQTLLFGSYQVHDGDNLIYEGLFHGEDLTERQLCILTSYAAENDLPLLSVREYVDDVFLPEVYDLGTLCLGFNLPFDISRIAADVGNARGRNRGAFSFKLTENPKYPRLIIKHDSDKRAFIHYTKGLADNVGNVRKKKGSRSFRGYFIDLKTAAFALTDIGHSLASACNHFKAECRKGEAEEHGKVSVEYIEYNRQDVKATHALYRAIWAEYEKYGLGLPIDKLYSPASLGKAYLDAMGLKPFMFRNPQFPKEVLGWTMQTFHGGRSEVRCRKTPMEIAYMDFLSMYPTVCILQGFWKYVTASRIDAVEVTEKVIDFIEQVDLDLLAQAGTWANLNAICLVHPEEDILPIRAKFGQRDAYNTGINYITSKEPIWYTLSDVVASKLLTGHSPRIEKAIQFIPRGVQRNLQTIKIIGGREVSPYSEDLYLALMEHRDHLKQERDRHDINTETEEYHHLDTTQKAVKIIANATAYGIYIEINTSPSDGKQVTAYGSTGAFPADVSKEERNGRYYNPILATLITSAARLVLAITEKILSEHGEHHVFCDTDSMGVPPSMVQPIQDYFQQLSPYKFKHHLFKLERENFGKDGVMESLYFYGISAKRYVLYNMRNGRPHIRKYSTHGLGHLRNPFSVIKDWEKVIWQDLLDEAYGLSSDDLGCKYSDFYAISGMTISTPDLMKRFAGLNRGRPYARRIKPFNFMLVGYPCYLDPETYQPVKPLAPYKKKASLAVYGDFIDYNSGRVMNGHQYWMTFADTNHAYKNKKEEKFDGDVGYLERKHLIVTSIRYIGKESNNLEIAEVLGMADDDYTHYLSDEQRKETDVRIREFILQWKPKDAKKYGISKRQLQRMHARAKSGGPLRMHKKTVRKVMDAMHHTIPSPEESHDDQ